MSHYTIPLRADRRYFAHTPAERRYRQMKREQPAPIVTVPGRTKRPPQPMTLQRAWNAIWPSLLGIGALLYLACLIGAWLVGFRG